MSIGEVFAADGALAREVDGFAPRAGQRDLAEAVARSLADGSRLIAEAGTGTGKTFAYLVPALLSGGRVIVSTGTKNLQDQLFHRDLPRVRDALGVGVRTALLKGRSNYLCLYRLDLATPRGPAEAEALQTLQQWRRSTRSGEVEEAGVVDSSDRLHAQVTSTTDNCLGSRCPAFDDCFVVKARRDAQAADLVIVNHHLLLSDFALKAEGFGQILPGADAVIVDEAHQLPELASQFFGVRVSTRQLNELIRDARDELGEFGDMPDADAAIDELAEATASAADVWSTPRTRVSLPDLVNQFGEGWHERLLDATEAVAVQLDQFADRSAGIANVGKRTIVTRDRLEQLGSNREGWVAWLDPSPRGGTLSAAPVDTAEPFRDAVLGGAGAWVFTSATLSMANDFSHFRDRLGLDDAEALSVDSPFDYQKQARLLLPPDMPAPNSPDYITAWREIARTLIEAARGGAFVLCTSHRAIQAVGPWLRDQLELTVLVQGDDNRSALLERFAEDGNAVLVGTSSFWEGVDVRGDALRMVLIDRLPFAAPGDPLLDARSRACSEAGGNPFMDLQVPAATLMLRQGVGRLIRDASDRGLLVICDPRIRTKPYGRKMLASLPAIPVLDAVEPACAWLAEIAR